MSTNILFFIKQNLSPHLKQKGSILIPKFSLKFPKLKKKNLQFYNKKSKKRSGLFFYYLKNVFNAVLKFTILFIWLTIFYFWECFNIVCPKTDY